MYVCMYVCMYVSLSNGLFPGTTTTKTDVLLCISCGALAIVRNSVSVID